MAEERFQEARLHLRQTLTQIAGLQGPDLEESLGNELKKTAKTVRTAIEKCKVLAKNAGVRDKKLYREMFKFLAETGVMEE